MTTPDHLPDHHRTALRTLIRYAVVMAVVGLLVGVAFQESAKKLEYGDVPAGLYLESIQPLALVHGHVFQLGVLLPLAMAGALVLGMRAGGAPVGPRATAWLTRGYLTCAAASLILQLYKGYHVLLSVRGGDVDLAAIDAALFGGVAAVRHGIYGVAHTGMAVSLGVFLVALWRSLSQRDA